MNIEERLARRIKETPEFMWLMPAGIEAPLIAWITAHGFLLLALRHPGTQGQSRQFAENLVKQIEEMMFEAGVLEPEDLEDMRADQAQAERENEERRPLILIPGKVRRRACGCMDDSPCPGGCYWMEMDTAVGLGLCSRCAGQ